MTDADAIAMPETVLAIDPGSVKCGLAVVAGPSLQRLHLQVVETERLVAEVSAMLRLFPQVCRILIGSGTGSATLRRALKAALPQIPLMVVDEHGSSERARRRFVAEIPGLGWRCILPKSLRFPERPYDDFVALLFAEDYFLQKSGTVRSDG